MNAIVTELLSPIHYFRESLQVTDTEMKYNQAPLSKLVTPITSHASGVALE